VYAVDTEGLAQEQTTALPVAALSAFAELRVVLETAPWSGEPYLSGKPDGPMRTRTFGDGGLVTYLVLEEQRRVDVLLVQWAGQAGSTRPSTTT
jgi:hypothetical protein